MLIVGTYWLKFRIRKLPPLSVPHRAVKPKRFEEGFSSFTVQDRQKEMCPEDEVFEHRSIRFWHVFWIPLIRLGSGGEHVRCRVCHSIYDPGVLESAE